MANVEIITIGDELLIGQVIDTNSAWMGQELNKVGFDIKYKTTVGDCESDILDALDKALSRVSIILLTGGIGPTKDDITKKTLCKYFETPLVFDAAVLQNIEVLIAKVGYKLNELTRNQAYVPQDCTVIQNKVGTAPLTWFEKDGKILVSMPGVPFEMKAAMTEEIIPRLQAKFKERDTIQHQTFWVSNFSESLLAIHLKSFEHEMPSFAKLAYLPSSGLIRLRISGKHADETVLTKAMNSLANKLKLSLNDNIIAQEDKPIELLLSELLRHLNLNLALAESCTGGKIASMITALPGASSIFKGGVVAYSNEVKNKALGVSIDTLEQHGAVSQMVVEEMAVGAANLLGSDCAIATSGIAGPDGATQDKPVGTTWIAAYCKGKLVAQKYQFGNNRENNILKASNTALLMLYKILKC
ncbi:CinA-like protein [Bacteroidales bacterium]|nr:CinA-like protein [Bacteroidales bacterium]